MSLYYCHFVDHGKNIRSTERFEAKDDATAIERALSLNIPSLGAGFELWREEILIHEHRNHRR